MTMSRAERILSLDDSEMKCVSVPEWKEDFYIKSITGSERDKFEESVTVGKGKKVRVSMEDFRAKFIAITACEQNGELIFNQTQIKELGKKNNAVITKLFDIAQKLNGMSNEDVDDMVKNSEAAQNDTSTSS